MPSLLEKHLQKDLLRFLTCGSVDDGKSTLIGRLLYDAGLVPDDQLATLRADQLKRGLLEPDLSLLLDGLQAEREQGITIDVAYRYFSTEQRKFIVADTPGHEQYTANMVTGASHCQLALLLVDARKGVLSQTRRHLAVVRLLGLQHVAVVVNKLDLLNYNRETYLQIEEQIQALGQQLGLQDLHCFPISAVTGANVVHRSEQTDWYEGLTLLNWLEEVEIQTSIEGEPFRLPVQLVSRPHQDFRGYMGTVTAGQISVGDKVLLLPSQADNQVKQIVGVHGEQLSAQRGEAVRIVLEKETDFSRGEVLVLKKEEPMIVTDQFEASLVWFGDQPLRPGKRYELRLGTVAVPATIKRLLHRLEIQTMQELPSPQLERNDLGRCELALEKAIPCDRYEDLPATGSFILVDRVTDNTIAAGMITATASRQVVWHQGRVDKALRSQLKGQTPKVLWFTGLSGSGKSTLANALEQRLHELGYHTYLLDGDNVRHGLNRDLGFQEEDRAENIRRVGEVSKLMLDAGLIVLVSFISPFKSERQQVRELMNPGEFFEVFVDTPIEVCEERDPKGLYKLAREGKLPNFTGISSPYEPPDNPELILNTHQMSQEENLKQLLSVLRLS